MTLQVTPQSRSPLHRAAESDEYLTSLEVAERYKYKPGTVRLALRDQSLHGDKPTGSSQWRILASCAKAWAHGADCGHKRYAIGRPLEKGPRLRLSA